MDGTALVSVAQFIGTSHAPKSAFRSPFLTLKINENIPSDED